MLPRVTLIGRPNVGKSSLFNALSRHRIAIVSDIENTTRDIIEYTVHDEEQDFSYILADSGWIVQADNETLLSDVQSRVDQAILSSDLLLFVLEFDRVTEFDEQIAKRLRRAGKRVLLIANKADNPKRAVESYNLLSLGFPEVIPTSPMQSRWLDELKLAIVRELKDQGFVTTYASDLLDPSILKLAIIGRPNVGKSSLVNALAGEMRSIVKDMPGTTRDSIDSLVEFAGKDICLIDTAGIRRAGKVGNANIEQWSVMRAESSIERSDVVAVVIDAFDWVTHQDEVIVGKAIEAKKWILLVLNKWDKVLEKPNVGKDTILDRYMQYLSKKFDFLSYAPVVFTQAIDGKRIDLVLEHALQIFAERQKRVKTGIFNKFLEQISYDHAPTGSKKSHKPRIFYGSQVGTNPPKFLISVNNSDHFHFSYIRYIENKIREIFGFEGTPIEIELRSRKSMYKSAEKWGSKEEYFWEDELHEGEEKKKEPVKKKKSFSKKKPSKKPTKKAK